MKRRLFIVDPQNGFMDDGTLPVQGSLAKMAALAHICTTPTWPITIRSTSASTGIPSTIARLPNKVVPGLPTVWVTLPMHS